MNGILQYLSFCDWHISLGIRFLRGLSMLQHPKLKNKINRSRKKRKLKKEKEGTSLVI